MVWLKFPEREVWKMTPRKFFALLTVHLKMLEAQNGGSSDKAQGKRKPANKQPQTVYADQVSW